MTLVEWLKRSRKKPCPKCEPRKIAYSLVRFTGWCPKCGRVWVYRYYNIEQSIKKARRCWWYEDDPKNTFTRIQVEDRS